MVCQGPNSEDSSRDFAVIPGGYITAEKGINRIKILNSKGEFVEAVS